MFSPYDAVYGHDTTYIRRMTVEEYVTELKEEEMDVSGKPPSPPIWSPRWQQENPGGVPFQPSAASPPPPPRRTRQYEQRRVALLSRNPNVVFSSKYPMYDRLGRELCVAYQMQDMAVQQELRRLEQEERRGGHDSRRSGVRLSAELPIASDGTASRPSSIEDTTTTTTLPPPSTAETHEGVFSRETSQTARHYPSESGDSLVDIDVSATSQYPSVSASRTGSSHPVSARPSEFSIFRESGAVGKARSSVPVRTVAEEDRIFIRRQTAGSDATAVPLRATSMPASTVAQGEWRRRSEKRRRSRSSGGRPSRVRFLAEVEEAEEAHYREGRTGATHETAHGREKHSHESSPPQHRSRMPDGRGAATSMPPRLPTPPPLPLSDPEFAVQPTRRDKEAEVEAEATRWTTLSRGSAAVRATKQLFRGTTQASSPDASRMTATLFYGQPIPSSAYGLTATTIPASKVRDLVEQNVEMCAAAMSQRYTNGGSAASGGEATSNGARGLSTPALQCGAVVQLGSEWYRLVHFHVVAEVYEAVRVEAPAGEGETNAENESLEAATEDGGTATGTDTNAKETDKPAKAQKGDAGGDNTPGCQAPTQATVQATVHRQEQYLVYRWRNASLAKGGDEACRVALGLSLVAPHTHVTGFRYADGGGLTLVTMPAGYHAVPLSGLPLSLRSYTAVLRLALKAFSAMVARRTVHGNLSALGDLFLVWPVASAEQGPAEAKTPSHTTMSSVEPFVMLLHWERWVDFGMFVDRNAGRTIPYDHEDGAVPALLYYSNDLLSGLQLFLEHALAAELTSEQYILLQKLVVLAAEPTHVANHLIQLKNLMLTLPTDTTALQKSFEAAVVDYTA